MVFCVVLFGWLQPSLAGNSAPSLPEVEVNRVIDGDTVILVMSGTETRVRLADIDAPELRQAHGVASRDVLTGLLAGCPVTLLSRGCDRYGRLLATLFAGDNNINLVMVRTGNAWRYRYARKTGPIAEAEVLARTEGRGLWARDGAVAPWEFRKWKTARRSACVVKAMQANPCQKRSKSKSKSTSTGTPPSYSCYYSYSIPCKPSPKGPKI